MTEDKSATCMDVSLEEKLLKLRRVIAETDGLAVAFSGGLDSSLLAAVAVDVLGDRALAVTATSPLYPQHEFDEAVALVKTLGIRHIVIESDELAVTGFAENPPDRCYLCKKKLFCEIRRVADKCGIDKIADGNNVDDLGDYRPGRRAAEECGVLSPLLTAGMTKNDIRALSRQLGLPTADKAAFACLASRFPYGVKITEEKLAAVATVENELRRLGFGQFRVRHQSDTARIEVAPADILKLCQPDTRAQIAKLAHDAGFLYVAVDLDGYRTGSMNAALKRK